MIYFSRAQASHKTLDKREDDELQADRRRDGTQLHDSTIFWPQINAIDSNEHNNLLAFNMDLHEWRSMRNEILSFYIDTNTSLG
jgi:hypothetical protein